MAIPNEFYINNDQYNYYSTKALDWFIKSWELKGWDKKIALGYQGKYNEKAMTYLKKAAKYLNEETCSHPPDTSSGGAVGEIKRCEICNRPI